MPPPTEKQAFAKRLRATRRAQGLRSSPTALAHEFNLRHLGGGFTVHAAHNWLLGLAIPTQDKLQVLAEWLQVSPQELRFGPAASQAAAEPDALAKKLGLVDREMLTRYMGLSAQDRKTVRELVAAFARPDLAATPPT